MTYQSEALLEKELIQQLIGCEGCLNCDLDDCYDSFDFGQLLN